MGGTALDRFWRGVREPWELLAWMRRDRPLWRRYWRTVFIQAALTLMAGLAVFWLFKHGEDAWHDAFGPEEVQEASASPVGAPGDHDAAETPASSSGTEGAPARAHETPRLTPHGKRGASQTPPPVPPPPTAPTAVPPTAAPPEAHAGAPKQAAEDDDADEDEDASKDADEDLEATVEQKAKALEQAPPEERGKRTAELVAAALAQAKKEAT
ncbi:MAG TPA: hypothetical protein VGF31_14810, partial [Myxococcaceae bacterium]